MFAMLATRKEIYQIYGVSPRSSASRSQNSALIMPPPPAPPTMSSVITDHSIVRIRRPAPTRRRAARAGVVVAVHIVVTGVLVVLDGSGVCMCMRCCRAGRDAGHVLADDLPADVDEDFVHVCAAAGAGLVVWRITPLLRDGKGSRAADLSVFFQVGLVAHQYYGDVWIVFEVDELLAEFVEFVE